MEVILKTIISLILVLLSIFNQNYKPEPVDKDASKKLIEEMVAAYGYYEDEANDRVNVLLDELKETDKTEWKRWSKIMDLWRAGLRQLLNYDVLPDGLPDTEELCIVVLGFELYSNGSMRGELVKRLEVAYASAEKYKNAYVLCTGGGTASYNKTITEAGQMAKWLKEKGIDEKRIIVEDKSESTAQNVIYTYDILLKQYPQVKKIAIVSSDYHIEPSILFFEAYAEMQDYAGTEKELEVVSNASWKSPPHILTVLFRAGALIELTGDEETANKLYNRTYDFESLLPLH